MTVLIIVTSIVGLAQLFLIKRVIDDVLPNRDTDLLVWATVGMVAVAAVSGLQAAAIPAPASSRTRTTAPVFAM